QDRDHVAQPRLLRGRGFPERARRPAHAREPERSDAGRPEAPERAGVQRPVPPGSLARSARRRPSVRPVRRADARARPARRAAERLMPRRRDLRRILVLGSGPIVIGQACEFDYSGTQAIKALKAEGFETVLVNSNPATIMTDPGVADRTYVEPLTPEYLEAVIERERPDALLPTVGGQTALNLATALAQRGTLARHGVEV